MTTSNDVTSDPYATPTDEEWAAIEARHDEARLTFDAAGKEHQAAFKVWGAALDDWGAELDRYRHLKALRTPVRDYVSRRLEHYIYRRPSTAQKIDAYHRPADVQQVLDDLIAEGRVRRIGKGYEWIQRPAA
jgi:hypothetical protein